MWAKTKPTGFTIVELLIVIVVIAILAAITIVAFNGVQDRAKASSASQAVAQSSKKVKYWQVEKESQSPSCTEFYELLTGTPTGAPVPPAACAFDVKGTNYQYTPSTTVAGGYCVTATVGNKSYKMSEASSPTSGGCSGHGQGGSAAITNLVMNPSVESNGNGWVANWGTGGTGNLVRMTDGGVSGTSYMRGTWSTAPTSGTTGGVFYNHPSTGQVTEGTTYTASASVRLSKSQRMQISIYWINSSGGSIATSVNVPSVLNPNTWSRLSVTGTAPAGAVRYFIVPFCVSGTGFAQWAIGDTVDSDAMMMTEGTSLYNYADGGSADWLWSSTQHNSISTGPAL